MKRFFIILGLSLITIEVVKFSVGSFMDSVKQDMDSRQARIIAGRE